MPENKPRQIIQSKGGVFQELSLRVKLILRLIADPRVSPLLKLLPIGSVVYLFVPDLVPFIVDDAAIIWLGTSIFIEMCPPGIVAEHMEALRRTIQVDLRDAPKDKEDEEILEGEFRDE
jgi:hypothetical protein